MANRDSLVKAVGITHNECTKTGKQVIKARVAVDMIDAIKRSGSGKEYTSYIKVKGNYTKNTRCDYVELPSDMTKIEAFKFALSHPDFQSPADQLLIQEQLGSIDLEAKALAKAQRATARAEKQAVKAAKKAEKSIKTTKKTAPSLDSIKARARKSSATVQDVLSAVDTTPVQG
jgi:hypothetical protein